MSSTTRTIETIKKDFPIFEANPSLVYLDSAATTQRPQCVIDAMHNFVTKHHANVHRGIYDLSIKASEQFDDARRTIAGFINAKNHEIIFTKNATEGFNLIAQSLLQHAKNVNKTEIALTQMEHHANIVPWQHDETRSTNYTIAAIPLTEDLQIDYQKAEEIITEKTLLVSFTLQSNVTGVITDAQKIITLAKAQGALTCIDATQAMAHQKIDVEKLGCDFLVFSGHKMYGPTGIGVVYVHEKHHDTLLPYQKGGDMIETVSFEKSTFQKAPLLFEAGTQYVEGAIGLAEACRFIKSIGFDTIQKHDTELREYCMQQLENIGAHYYPSDASTTSFALENVHPHDIASLLDDAHICIRAGHHCAMPFMDILGAQGTARVSFGVYTTKEDIDLFIKRLKQIKELFSKHKEE